MIQLIIAALISLPMVTFAASSSQSEFFHQAGEGTSELTPALSYNDAKITIGTTNITAKTTALSLNYEYGISSTLSAGATLKHTTSNTKTDNNSETKDAGLNDIELFVKGTNNSLKYGATLSVSPGNNVTDASGNENEYTGGHKITPYLGYEWNLGSGITGAKISKNIALGNRTEEDQTTTPSTKTKYSGSELTSLSFFYESNINTDLLIGASFDWKMYSDRKDVTNSTTQETVSPIQTITIYAPMKLSSGTLLPSLGYDFTTDDKISGVKIEKYTALLLSVGYRTTF